MGNLVNGTGNTEHISAETVPVLYGSKRPKIWLRREKDERKRCVIRTFDLNRGKQGEQWALENLMAIYAGQPVAVE